MNKEEKKQDDYEFEMADKFAEYLSKNYVEHDILSERKIFILNDEEVGSGDISYAELEEEQEQILGNTTGKVLTYARALDNTW